MIVTIDGPAGAGKSSVSRMLAARLEFRFLDTGAMYRAIAWSAIENAIELTDPDALARHAASLDIRIDGDRTLLNDVDISDKIRTEKVARSIRFVADHPEIRAQLVELQRETTSGEDYVTEGRDQGTIAFPDAACKIFLTATPVERARRRMLEIAETGDSATLEEVLANLRLRDHNDMKRPVGALRKAEDAVEVCTDNMTSAEVVDKLELIVRMAMAHASRN